jgi:hypothetical protein
MGTKHLRRRPSPATVIACVALFVSLGGTSYALAVGSIGSREIRDSSIRSIDVRNNGLHGHDLARDGVGGGAIEEEKLDPAKLDASRIDAARLDASRIGVVPTARTALNVATPDGLALQAFVAADGGRSRTRGVTDVVKAGTGRYRVVFDRNVSSCVYAATLNGFTNANPGFAGTGEIAAQADGSAANAVYVQTARSDGTVADRDFLLLVSC